MALIIACSPLLSVLEVGLLAASPDVPVLLAWPWQLSHRVRHVVGGATTFSFGSGIFVDKYVEENRFPSGRHECANICDA